MSTHDLGWKYDLPSPNEKIEPDSIKANLYPAPNYFNELFIELPRSTLKARGYWLSAGSITLTLAVCLYFLYSPPLNMTSLESSAVDLLIFAIGVFFVTPYIRMDLGLPRDEPVRFNRLRRKVYFYQYRFSRLNPFGRKNWGIKPVAYNWDDLTAEAYRIYLPMGYGGLKEWIMLSIRSPDTNEVIDRVFLTDDIEKGEQYWALARLFMQQGPDVLPDFIHLPTDWDEFPDTSPWEHTRHRNPFDRLAPKVQWPAEMDLESRTGPERDV
jgi:hypothetical protein